LVADFSHWIAGTMGKKRHLVLVLHGERAFLPTVRHLVDWVREKGHVVEPLVTWESGDAERITREAAMRGVDVIVACGGDGTVNEVLNGLTGFDVPLGIIPLGTANDFARQVGIPGDADHAMDVILRRRPTRIDTASMNGRRFLNVSTGGIGAEATAETPADAKRAFGPLAYALTGLRKLAELAPHRARFEGTGFSLETDFLLFAVGNARATGGGTVITPQASVEDGLLDVCVMEAMPRREFAKLALRVKRGEHLDDERVHYVQLSRITIDSKEPVTVNIDGESQRFAHLEYAAHRGDVRVFLPHLPGEEDEEEIDELVSAPPSVERRQQPTV
jgi:diacylglycerol kinase (ATP)